MSTYTISSKTCTRTVMNSATASDDDVDDDGEVKPSQVKNRPWIMETKRFPSTGANLAGKWMLFYPSWALDAAWVKAKRKFRKGELLGIGAMKVSTARENPRSSENDSGVIIFYCGPPTDQTAVMGYGNNLVRVMNYASYNSNLFIYYKSDEQTQRGTVATGQRVNHLYKIPVPRFSAAPVDPVKGSKRKRDVVEDFDGVCKRVANLGAFSSPTLSFAPLPSDASAEIGRSADPMLFSDTNVADNIRVKFRLESGDATEFLTASFRSNQRIAELLSFLDASAPASFSNGGWNLFTTFPTRELTDVGMTLAEARLANCVVVARRL